MISARTNMSSRSKVALAFVACVLGVGTWACSLNPQPIPPGFSDTVQSDAGRAGDATEGPFDGLDGAGGGDHDATAPVPEDGGADAPNAADAESDAPTDAEDGGG